MSGSGTKRRAQQNTMGAHYLQYTSTRQAEGSMPILLRSPYNLRPRTARVTAYQTNRHGGQPASVIRADLDTSALAAQAQGLHEQYLAAELPEEEDPEVEDGSEALHRPLSSPARSEPDAMQTQSVASTMSAPWMSRPASMTTTGRRSRMKAYSKQKKREGRAVQGEDARYSPYVDRRTKVCANKKKQQAEKIHTDFAWSSSVHERTNRVAKSAMVGVRPRDSEYPREPATKQEILQMGLDEINWAGDQDITIVDSQGRVIVYLSRKSAAMDPVLARVERQFEIASEAYAFKPSQKVHRRGKFKAAASGASYGGGQQRVGNLKDTRHNRDVIERHLLHNEDVINLAGFVDSAFQNAARELHAEYGRVLTSICDRDHAVRRNFSNSVFAGVTFNFGPRACTVPHTDHLNIPTGWCAVVALGDFDPNEGGHLILWDLKLLIRFPHGAIIFLPSALLVHSKTVVPEGQRRYSFTQYTAGGLARWVECGFQSQKEFLASGGSFERTPQQRWQEGLAKFPMWDTWRSD
ncbi:hypothetical protein C8T65DRAFT_828681 [Cerioporus squamosus]|nr:hypothetical protein C8T65DRAFT_828681 [Cerioporus squamosus]